MVFEPDDHTSLNHYAWTRDKLVIVTLADVVSRVQTVTPGSWAAEPVPGIPDNTNTVIVDTDDLGDEIFLDFSGFTTPSRLLHGAVEGPLDQIKSRAVVLRRRRSRRHTAFRHVGGRHRDPVLRGRSP